jgi:hypothetical protein
MESELHSQNHHFMKISSILVEYPPLLVIEDYTYFGGIYTYCVGD